MNFLPVLTKINRLGKDGMSRQGDFFAQRAIYERVEQHASGVGVRSATRLEISQVGVELVEIRGMEALAATVAGHGGGIVFGVDDDGRVVPAQCRIGVHVREEIGRLAICEVPCDSLAFCSAARKMYRVKVAYKVLKESPELLFIAGELGKAVRARGLGWKKIGKGKPAQVNEEAVGRVVRVYLDLPKYGSGKSNIRNVREAANKLAKFVARLLFDIGGRSETPNGCLQDAVEQIVNREIVGERNDAAASERRAADRLRKIDLTAQAIRFFDLGGVASVQTLAQYAAGRGNENAGDEVGLVGCVLNVNASDIDACKAIPGIQK